MTLPGGHLSPSAANAWERCEVQFRIFRLEGNRARPDFNLEAKHKTHEVLLEHDLKAKIQSGHNRADSELSEIYRGAMEESVPLAREDPNLEGPVDKVIEDEVRYFDKIIGQTRAWRQGVTPMKVEERLEGEIGGIPIVGYLDLMADEPVCDRVIDLKRQGQSPPKGSAEKHRQLITYATLTGVHDVALAAVVENTTPKMAVIEGVVTDGEKARVAVQYQAVASQIEHAVEKDIWKPVDHGDKGKAWVCSAKFCGAWRKDATDWLSGRKIACPYGERSEVKISLDAAKMKV